MPEPVRPVRRDPPRCWPSWPRCSRSALGLAALHFRSDPLPAGTSTFASGGGVTYTAPDGGFQVLLPQTPALDQRTATVDGATATVYAAAVTTNDYVIGAVSVVLPDSVLSRRIDDVLDAALTGGINGVNGKLVHKSMLTHDTLPAIEGSFKAPDGYRARTCSWSRRARRSSCCSCTRRREPTVSTSALEDSLIIR